MKIFNPSLISGSYTGPQTGSMTNIFSRAATVVDETNFVTTNFGYTIWRSPYMCELTTITGKVAGATGAAINARKSGSAGYSYHTASNLTLSVIDQWTSAASVDNITYQPGDSLEFIFSGSAGVTGIFIQADFRRI